MNDVAVIKSQCRLLIKFNEKLSELFGGKKGSVQFFQHKDHHDIFIIQIRKAHLVDIGSAVMALSFLIKEQYHVFQGITMREQLGMPPEGYPEGQDYEYAFKHVFMRFKFHPRLQEMLFTSDNLKPKEVYQDMARIPYVVEGILNYLASMEGENHGE